MSLTRMFIEGIILGFLVVIALSVFVELGDTVVERGYYYQLAYPNQVAP